MKKFYSILLLTLLSFFGLTASAYTLTIKADPSKIDKVQVGGYTDIINDAADDGTGPGTTFKEFSLEGVVNTFECKSEDAYIYCMVTPKTGVSYTYNATIYNADGSASNNFLKKKSGVAKNFIRNFQDYDGGVLEVVEAEEVQPVPFTVNFSGEASKVRMVIGTSTKSLVEGENAFQCLPTDYVCFYPQGVSKLYLVKLGETEIPVIDNMGTPAYQIKGSDIKAGDVITVATEFPLVPLGVTLSCNDWDYVKTVKLDNLTIARDVYSAEQIGAFAGQTFYIACDKNNYILNEMKINGDVVEAFSGSYSVMLEGDLHISFDVTKVERNMEFNLNFGNLTSGELRTATDAFFSYDEKSENVVKYADSDLPMLVFPANQSQSSADNVCFVYRNDNLVATGVSRYELNANNLAAGDKYFFQYENPYFYVNMTGAEHAIVTLYGEEVVLQEGENELAVKVNPDEQRIIFKAEEGYRITTATANGTSIYPTATGEYRWKPKTGDQFVIVVEEIVPQYITINVNNAAGLFYGGFVILRDQAVELQDGENKIDLEEYPYDEWTSPNLIIVPNSSYFISQMMYNGEDVTDSQYFDYDGYYFEPEVGDVYDITVEKIAREDRLVILACGVENALTPYLVDVTGSIKMINTINEGYNEAFFNEKYDCPMLFGCEGLLNGAKAYVYLNNEEVKNNYGYDIEAVDDDVLKLYFMQDAPAWYTTEIIVHGSQQAPRVVADNVTNVDLVPADGTSSIDPVYMHKELQGTSAYLFAPDGDKYNEVYINGNLVEKALVYDYNFNANNTIEIYANDTSSISIINADDADNEVYNLQGIKVTGKNVPAGIYIVNGKKLMLR